MACNYNYLIFKMDSWKEIANCSIAKPLVGETNFKSDGDWSMIVHQKEKEGISREEALQIIRSEYEIEEESCEPK